MSIILDHRQVILAYLPSTPKCLIHTPVTTPVTDTIGSCTPRCILCVLFDTGEPQGHCKKSIILDHRQVILAYLPYTPKCLIQTPVTTLVTDTIGSCGIVFTCTYFRTCTDNSTYLYEERHRQIRTLELKPVDIHNKLLKTRRYS